MEAMEEVGLVGQVGEFDCAVCARCACGRIELPIMSEPLAIPLPRTRRSKSFSPTLEKPKGSVEGMLIKSSERGLLYPLIDFEVRSLSFLVCSCSILDDKVLIRSIYS